MIEYRGVVALVPTAALSAPFWSGGGGRPAAQELDRLAPRERKAWDALRGTKRRGEWLAARIAAKWLYLSYVRGRRAADDARSFRLTVVGPGHLRRFGVEECRGLEVLSARWPEPGPPELHVEDSTRQDLTVSLSHSGGWAACALCAGGAVGIDVERVESRRPEFEEIAFGEEERAWAAARSVRRGEPVSVLFTWLWSLKEAALKAGCGGSADPAAISVSPPQVPHELYASARAPAQSFSPRPVTIGGRAAEWVSVALDRCITTVVRFEDS